MLVKGETEEERRWGKGDRYRKRGKGKERDIVVGKGRKSKLGSEGRTVMKRGKGKERGIVGGEREEGGKREGK